MKNQLDNGTMHDLMDFMESDLVWYMRFWTEKRQMAFVEYGATMIGQEIEWRNFFRQEIDWTSRNDKKKWTVRSSVIKK